MVQNITYRIVCNHCTKEGRKSEYIGESSRTGYYRGTDHFNALTNKDQTNPLVEHWQDSHQGVDWDFSMTIIKVHDSALQRQVAEDFAIGNFKGDTLLKRKGVWGNNLPPKLVIEEAVEEKEQHQRCLSKYRSS